MDRSSNEEGSRRAVSWADPTAPDFQIDLNCAVTSAARVLVTGSSAVAHDIAVQIYRRTCHPTSPFITLDCERSGAGHQIRRAFRAAAPDGILFVRNVDHLGPAQQPTLCALLGSSGVRVIAESSASLFALVQHDRFDERLFYRLNQIHLIASALP